MKAFHDENFRRREFYVHKKVWLYNYQLKLFRVSSNQGGMTFLFIDEIFDCGVILISNPKTRLKMKVNGQRLKSLLPPSHSI